MNKSIDINDLVKEMEKDPKIALALSNARKKLAKIFAEQQLEDYQVGTSNYNRLMEGKGPNSDQ